jgi:hypothetical protein
MFECTAIKKTIGMFAPFWQKYEHTSSHELESWAEFIRWWFCALVERIDEVWEISPQTSLEDFRIGYVQGHVLAAHGDNRAQFVASVKTIVQPRFEM